MKPIRRKDSSPGRSLPGLEGEGRLSRSGFLSQNRSRDLAESVGHPEKAQVGLPVFGRMRAAHDRLAVVAEPIPTRAGRLADASVDPTDALSPAEEFLVS